MTRFLEFYQEIYQERWPKLLLALKNKEQKVLRESFLQGEMLEASEENLSLVQQRRADGGLKYYVMDQASVYAARALVIQKNQRILDMCAAPGGKSLILIEALAGSGEIILNEPSAGRRERLKKVVQQYVPRSWREGVFIKGIDGQKYGLRQADSFDGILVDAPCSGERHLLKNERELANWSPKRTKRLAAQQYGLLCSALLALKEGGQIIYSTCSISPYENDLVIEKLLNKKKNVVVNPLADYPGGERAKFGIIFLPDVAGLGPLYFCSLSKVKPE